MDLRRRMRSPASRLRDAPPPSTALLRSAAILPPRKGLLITGRARRMTRGLSGCILQVHPPKRLVPTAMRAAPTSRGTCMSHSHQPAAHRWPSCAVQARTTRPATPRRCALANQGDSAQQAALPKPNATALSSDRAPYNVQTCMLSTALRLYCTAGFEPSVATQPSGWMVYAGGAHTPSPRPYAC